MPSDMPDADVIGAEMMARLDALAAHSEAGEGLTRRFASAEHRAAGEMILGWMRDAGTDDGIASGFRAPRRAL